MAESERLQVLRQQRALMLEQLALLEKQIALEVGSSIVGAASVSPTPAIVPTAQATARPRMSPASEAEADALLAQLIADEGKAGTFSKSGCWLIFSGVMAAILVLVGVVYYFFYR